MARIPGSTYRIQLHKDFTFDDAGAIAGYLKRLGITHVYSSPYLQAAPGSTHGYDVVDHRSVNEELGGAEAHQRFSIKLGETGLGQVLDIVPNHMSLGRQNRLWWDVLENGANSRYAGFFDIDWNPSEERLRDKVLVPVLGDQYGRVLSAGGIKLIHQGSVFTVEAADQSLPVAPETLSLLLSRAAEYAGSDTLNFLADSYSRLPSAEPNARKVMAARHRDKIVLHDLLDRLCSEESKVCEAIDRAVREINADPDALDQLLSLQNYRLSYWKTADQQLGYRRFFDVNTLIGLRVEREYVFDETHALIVKWLKTGVLDGVRVDHPDGLRDPLEYFRRLRDRAPEAWIVGEKILEPGEWLREDWPIAGTTGYDFLNVVLGTLIRPEGLKRLGEHYALFTGETTAFPVLAHDKKIAVTQEALGSDVNRLASILVDICESHREQRDFTRSEIRRVIREVASCFSVYRTYVVPDRDEITAEDRRRTDMAFECAKNNRPDLDPMLFDFTRDVLQLKVRGRLESEFVYRFQQFTSPVMAKGVEDTAFYDYNRLTAMNEVGGDPACDGFALSHFHDYNRHIQEHTPGTMVTLSTHDTKRSDDVRARLAVLTEVPDEFMAAAKRWSALNKPLRKDGVVDCGTEWFLFQSLAGAWPITAKRTKTYMQKAMREAKLRTSWVANDTEYEEAVNTYIDGALADPGFVADLEEFVRLIGRAGQLNSLSQTLLKHVVPGVPDLYQGSEIWDFSMVDPDNRRPVDYKLRTALLEQLGSVNVAQVMDRMDEGLPKLWTIHKALTLRAEHPDWFGAEAAYVPIDARGPIAEHVIALLRGDRVLAVAPRWSQATAAWQDTSIAVPPGRWRNRLTEEVIDGGNVLLDKLLGVFPVALLVREDAN